MDRRAVSVDRSALGRRLREVRERAGLTLRTVAARAGVSESLVSQIERSRVSPSVDTLLALADVLEVDLEYLFRDYRREGGVSVVRAGERAVHQTGGVRYEQLSVMTDPSERYGIEAVMLEIPAGAERGSGEYGHRGKELGIILEGTAELLYGTRRHRLARGDSVSFNSNMPHVLRNVGQGVLRALWVNSPPHVKFVKR